MIGAAVGGQAMAVSVTHVEERARQQQQAQQTGKHGAHRRGLRPRL
jgi:hypothetical protein